MTRFSRERFILACTFLFGLLAHGYCYFNLTYSHDSLMVRQEDVYMMISVGRFLHLPYVRLRGDLYNPALVGALSLLFLGLAICLMARLLGMENRPLLCLTTGILTASTTITLINATYIQDIDLYMLALLLAAAGVLACVRFRRWGWIAGSILFCLSMGLYQAFFQAAVFLAMMYVVKCSLDRAAFREVLLTGVRLVGSLVLGLVLYTVTLQIVLRITGITLLSSYGLGSAAGYDSMGEMVRYLWYTCTFVCHYFLHPLIHLSTLAAWVNLFILAASLTILGALVWRRKIRGWDLALLLAVLCLMPFGMNVVFFISHGEEHYLMIFSFFLAYLFAAYLTETFLTETGPARIKTWALRSICCALAILLFGSTVYASQVYLKKDLEYQATIFTLTRVADRLEQLEGYVPGETPVAIVGDLDHSVLSRTRPGFEALAGGTGLWKNYAATYYATYSAFFQRILGYPINILPLAQSNDWTERTADLPAFPAVGSCVIIDGTAVIKLS